MGRPSIVFLFLSLLLLPVVGSALAPSCSAQQSSRGEIQDIIASSGAHFKKGQDAYTGGEFERARREFDEAVDTILIASIDVRSDEQLRIYYRELIEKINRFQIAALEQKDGGFTEQRHEPSLLDKIASLSDADLEETVGPQDDIGAKFNFAFTAAVPVKQFVGYFTRGRGRGTIEAGMLRSTRYRDMARRIFKEQGVPTDLIWLAQIESGWNPYALSSAEARGIWQFIPATGQRFGLAQNYWIDERSNPEKSTRAAAAYLKFLGDRYRGNWELALAAYNSGERTVDSAIARAGVRDFWRLHDGNYLPHETRNYVPAILAVIAIAKDPKKYGLDMPTAFPYKYESRPIAKQTDLRSLAKKLNVTYGELVDLNPELQRGSTPPGKHLLKVPENTAAIETAASGEAAPKRGHHRSNTSPDPKPDPNTPASPPAPATGEGEPQNQSE